MGRWAEDWFQTTGILRHHYRVLARCLFLLHSDAETGSDMRLSFEKPPKSKRHTYTRDARGRRIALLDPYELNLLRRYDIIPAKTLQSIAGRVGFGLPKWQHRGYIGCVVMFLLCVVFLVVWKYVRRGGIDIVKRMLWPMNLAVFALGAVQFWRSGRRARAKSISAIMLEHLRCPHCGYDVRGLPVDPKDKATVCPECGCAWQLSDSAVDDGPQESRTPSPQ